MSRFECLAFSMLSAVSVVAASPQQAPHADWRTIRTAHYRIHYPPVLADWAQDVASRVEGIHAQVVKLVGYEYPKPVQVVLRDPVEEANGETVPLLPYPYFTLWRTEPRSDTFMDAMSGWTEVLVTHEFVHMQHLTRPQNQPTWLERWLDLPLGPLVMKGERWVWEGYATLAEGRLTGSARPHGVSRSALLRQWAIQGNLPDYGHLNGFQGFRGGSMAYLVGSAYLEWLERQRPQTPDILQRLWKQMASKKRRSFDANFKATFGFTAKDGYDRFRAEVTHDALEWEARLKAEGLREGDLWWRSAGSLSDLSVSPDGSRLLATLDGGASPGLCVWDLLPKKKPAKTEAPKEEAPDPNEVADVAPESPDRKADHRLPRLNFQMPDRPWWVDDHRVGFMLKRRDAEGIQKRAPGLWRLEGDGQGIDLHPQPLGRGRWLALEPVNRQGRWMLECQGRIVPLPGQAAGRAVLDASNHTLYAACVLEGTWNLVRVPVTPEGFGPVERLTRTTSAVWNPAPSPDGKTLFFTRLDARGIEIRRLNLEQAPLNETASSMAGSTTGLTIDARILNPDAIISRPIEKGLLPEPGPVPPSEPYRAWDNQLISPSAGITLGPSGQSWQIGVMGNDLAVDRLAWQALISEGIDGGPSGANAALRYSGWAWNPSATVFLAREKPSHQRYRQTLGLDRERRGAEVSFTFDDRGEQPFWFSPVVAWERDERLDGPSLGEQGHRTLAGLRLGAEAHRARGSWGFGLQGEGQGFVGESRWGSGSAESWNAVRAWLKATVYTPRGPLSFRSEWGRIGGDAPEAFHFGGQTAALVPLSLEVDRVEQAALPAYQAMGKRLLRWRGEWGEAVHAYVEGTALWSGNSSRSAFQRVAGIECSLKGLMGPHSEEALRKLDVSLGAHRILDGALKNHDVITLNLVLRP